MMSSAMKSSHDHRYLKNKIIELICNFKASIPLKTLFSFSVNCSNDKPLNPLTRI